MPRYFFNLRQDEGLLKDPDGSDLPDLAAAYAEAIAEARDLLAAYVKAGTVLNGQTFEIVDAWGKILMLVPLRDALNLPH